jgi:putative oxidoreductase
VTAAAVIALIVRCGLVLLFLPFSAMDKVFNFQGAVGQAQQVFKPRPLAAVVLLTGLAIEIFCSLGIITGVADRAAAFVMAGYCAMTAVLYKQFWAQGDFWSAADGKGRGLFWDFLKNLSLGAGFLLIVVGTDGRGLAPFLSAPFGSSQPYHTHP